MTHDGEIEEDFGHHKMELFKNQARAILLNAEQSQSYIDSERTRDVDIVTAYKELKKHMFAAIGKKINNDVTAGKNYLKSTIAITQHSKNRMNKELLRYSLAQSKSILVLTCARVVSHTQYADSSRNTAASFSPSEPPSCWFPDASNPGPSAATLYGQAGSDCQDRAIVAEDQRTESRRES